MEGKLWETKLDSRGFSGKESGRSACRVHVGGLDTSHTGQFSVLWSNAAHKPSAVVTEKHSICFWLSHGEVLVLILFKYLPVNDSRSFLVPNLIKYMKPSAY